MPTERVSRARELRHNLTNVERLLWKQLRLRNVDGHKFRRQHPIGPFIGDFACIERRLVIELDGGQHAENAVYDQERDAWLRSHGWRVLRFWNNDVLEQSDAVLDAIFEALDGGPPS